MIPHSRPFVGREELAGLRRVIASGQLAQGEEVKSLEKELSSIAGHRYGIAVSSGTAALYLALRSLEIRPGDRVVMPSYVCTALLNAVNMIGAKPVLADIDYRTGNMTPDTVKKALTKRCKAVIVPHMFGYPADAAGIEALGIPVIEDCAQCVGARVGRRTVGNLTRVSVFSFYATKMIAAGEGGLVATSDRGIAAAIREFREYDKRKTYTPGFNFKLSDMHAAVAGAQLEKLNHMIELRRKIAAVYDSYIIDAGPSIEAPWRGHGAQPVYYRYVVRIADADRAQSVIDRMNKRGIACNRPIYKPVHEYLGTGRALPRTRSLQKRAVSLPIYPGLSRADAANVAKTLLRATR